MNESAALKKVINTIKGKKPERENLRRQWMQVREVGDYYREESIEQRYHHSYQKN